MSDSVNVRVPKRGVYNTTLEGGANLVAMAPLGTTCQVTLEYDHMATLDVTLGVSSTFFRVAPTSTIESYPEFHKKLMSLITKAHKAS